MTNAYCRNGMPRIVENVSAGVLASRRAAFHALPTKRGHNRATRETPRKLTYAEKLDAAIARAKGRTAE